MNRTKNNANIINGHIGDAPDDEHGDCWRWKIGGRSRDRGATEDPSGLVGVW